MQGPEGVAAARKSSIMWQTMAMRPKVRQSLICLSTAGALHHGMLHDPVFYATM